jgi:CBS domain-containing protein
MRRARRIRDVMTPDPITTTPGVSVDDAARVLLTKRIHRLPVVDADGRLVGVISRSNLVKAALAMRSAERERAAATSS